MTSKERAALRAKANPLEPIFQIGKEGISDNLVSQIDDALDVRELLKIRVHLETAPENPREFADKVKIKGLRQRNREFEEKHPWAKYNKADRGGRR